ncbi:type I secretion system permease/ATPase [Propionivibrio sp.]|uniref:type I secretion system permease/ATPase n=1 Tax=Propionivibrio sp. TaxID=2212460 RepID=UPI003BF368A8
MTKHILPRILARYRSSLLMLWVFSIFFNLLVLTLPLYMLGVFSNVLTSRSQDTLVLLTMAATIALLIQGALDFIRSRLLIRVGVTLDADLTPHVLESIIRNAAGSAQRNSQRLREAVKLRSFLTGPTIFTLFDLPFAPLYVLVIYLMHPALGTLALIGCLALAGIAVANELLTRAPIKVALKTNRDAQSRVDEFVRNADAIEAMGMMPAVLNQWQRSNIESLAALTQGSDSTSVTRAMAKFVRIMLQVGIYAVGAYLYLQNEVMVGAIMAASILMGRALSPLEALITTWKSMVGAWDSYLQIKDALEPKRLLPYRNRMIMPVPTGRLQLDRLVVAAPGSDRMILKGVSFTLEPGEFLGVVGPSGAGKSTLAKALVGIITPKMGSARLDGVDLSSWHSDDLGTHVGYLPQDVQLFSGTVRDNISRLGGNNDSQTVLQAAMMVGLHEAILQLPKGYDSEIGEAGGLLSAGQRQHLGLARALYGNPRLLVLDEPNSNLDSISEEALLQTMDEAKKRGITLVVITHRPSILRAADKLLMLNNGSVELFGPRAQVMRKLSPGAPRKEVEAEQQPKLQVVQGEN